ncbi:probable RNA 3'-terminal phosphate cyclase-like protein, partial [Tanacetum coccineum]
DQVEVQAGARGITNDHKDPSVDTFRPTTLFLKSIGVPAECLQLKIKNHGIAPKDGDKVSLSVPIIHNNARVVTKLLSWRYRLLILTGIARDLLIDQIIFDDLKWILMQKIKDFGLARFGRDAGKAHSAYKDGDPLLGVSSEK